MEALKGVLELLGKQPGLALGAQGDGLLYLLDELQKLLRKVFAVALINNPLGFFILENLQDMLAAGVTIHYWHL